MLITPSSPRTRHPAGRVERKQPASTIVSNTRTIAISFGGRVDELQHLHQQPAQSAPASTVRDLAHAPESECEQGGGRDSQKARKVSKGGEHPTSCTGTTGTAPLTERRRSAFSTRLMHRGDHARGEIRARVDG
jgi:hypothetical protein